MQTTPTDYNPPDQYNQYSFSDYDYSNYYAYDSGPSNNSVIQNGSGTTDAKGHFELAQTASLNNANTNQQTTFSVNVTDVGGNLVGDHASLIVYGSSLHPGIRTDDYVGTQGQIQTIPIVVLDLNGKPVAKQAVSVQIINQQWFSGGQAGCERRFPMGDFGQEHTCQHGFRSDGRGWPGTGFLYPRTGWGIIKPS